MPLRSVGLIRVTRVLVGLGVLVLVALVVLVGAAGCGSSAPRGSEGGRCQVDGSCDDDDADQSCTGGRPQRARAQTGQ